jgi:hypothetical protein
VITAVLRMTRFRLSSPPGGSRLVLVQTPDCGYPQQLSRPAVNTATLMTRGEYERSLSLSYAVMHWHTAGALHVRCIEVSR